jgi:hypothetical protein
MDKKILIVGSGGNAELVELIKARLADHKIEAVRIEEPKTPFEPEPIMITRTHIEDYSSFAPQLTRAERRKRQRKNKKKH